MRHSLSGGAWNPHDVNSVAATSESSIQFWDLRTMKKNNSIERAHVRNVDYNLKREHILVRFLSLYANILNACQAIPTKNYTVLQS
jgi:hypothetical protein